MEVKAKRITEIDELYLDAQVAIAQLHALLRKKKQNEGVETLTLLDAAKNTIMINLNTFREFDR